MRNVVANLSPDLLGLLLQSGSLARAKAGQDASASDALQVINGEESKEFQEGFQDILSMLTFGQGETNQITEDNMLIGSASEGAVQTQASPQNQTQLQNLIQIPTQVQTSGPSSLGHKATILSEQESRPNFQGITPDLQKILAQAKPKGAAIPVESSPALSMVEDGVDLGLLQRDLAHSPIAPSKLTARTKGLLTGSEFLGLKNGFEQGQLEATGQSTLEMKKTIPASYQAEQNKMMNSLATKKQNEVDGNSPLLTNKFADIPMASGTMPEKEIHAQRFLTGLKGLNMKTTGDLKAGQGLDPKVHDVIGKVSDYIVQAKFDKNNTLDVTLRHNEIGQFQMKVTKGMNGSGLDIMIRPHSTESQRFFSDNQQSLVKGLSDSGLKILDFKVSSPLASSQVFSEGKSDTSNGQFAGTRQDSHNSQSNSNHSEQHGSERRRELWEQARERLERQYA